MNVFVSSVKCRELVVKFFYSIVVLYFGVMHKKERFEFRQKIYKIKMAAIVSSAGM